MEKRRLKSQFRIHGAGMGEMDVVVVQHAAADRHAGNPQ